jgi:hypothetical protein
MVGRYGASIPTWRLEATDRLCASWWYIAILILLLVFLLRFLLLGFLCRRLQLTPERALDRLTKRCNQGLGSSRRLLERGTRLTRATCQDAENITAVQRSVILVERRLAPLAGLESPGGSRWQRSVEAGDFELTSHVS